MANSPDARIAGHHVIFGSLPRDQQDQAVRRLARAGHSDQTIAALTGLAVDDVRRRIAEGDKA